MSNWLDMLNIEQGAVPIDTTGAAVATDWVSLKNYRRVVFIINQGAWAGGTPAVTLAQATAVAGTGSKTLAFTRKWSKVGLTGTVWVDAAVTSNTFNLVATANRIEAIEVEAADLDTDNSFDCVQLGIASPGANADLIQVQIILLDPRYPQSAATMADAKVD